MALPAPAAAPKVASKVDPRIRTAATYWQVTDSGSENLQYCVVTFGAGAPRTEAVMFHIKDVRTNLSMLTLPSYDAPMSWDALEDEAYLKNGSTGGMHGTTLALWWLLSYACIHSDWEYTLPGDSEIRMINVSEVRLALINGNEEFLEQALADDDTKRRAFLKEHCYAV